MMDKFLLILLISSFYFVNLQTPNQSSIRQKKLADHGDNCENNGFCEPGLVCMLNRCMTKYESKNYEKLGMSKKDVCDAGHVCPTGKVCIQHRCKYPSQNQETVTYSHANETQFHLIFAGNIYSEKKVILSGKAQDNSFDYTRIFENVKNDIKHSDISVINPEILFGSEQLGLNLKKPKYVAPDALGEALANAGFNVILQSHERVNEKGEQGIELTRNFWKRHPNITLLGVIEEEGEKPYHIFTKKNLKIGIISYAFNVKKSLNKKGKFKMNLLNDKNKALITSDLSELRRNCDFVIVCVHWEKNTDSTPTKTQLKWAKFFADNNVDLVIGTRLHQVQPIAYVKGKTDKMTLVYFSLGDLVSTEKKPKYSLGGLANIVITKKGSETILSNYGIIPLITSVDKNSVNYSTFKLREYGSIVRRITDPKLLKEKSKNLMKWEALCEKVFDYFC